MKEASLEAPGLLGIRCMQARHSPAAPAMLFLDTTALGADTREAEGANTAAAISAGSVVRKAVKLRLGWTRWTEAAKCTRAPWLDRVDRWRIRAGF